jgi:MFS transporter, DHA1 family, inner membrane transport protein
MTATQAVLSPGRATRAFAMLYPGAFVIGSSELLIVGVLNLIAGDLGVSVFAAG